jgi:hypothetical protein
MIRKGQLAIDGADATSIADKFFTLAGMVVQTEREILTFQKIPQFYQKRDRTMIILYLWPSSNTN